MAMTFGIHIGHMGGPLAEMRRLVAIALSTVAPIHRLKGNGEGANLLSAAEINDLLFRAHDAAPADGSLDRLCIRRGDLRTALKVLREARMVSGSKK
jgi:hypothetical protein